MCCLSSLSIYYLVDDNDWMKAHKIRGMHKPSIQLIFYGIWSK